nr:unnamed protein product [Ananas comosus var. bracteatus]
MDGKGKALLTLKPQILSLYDQWDGYKGEEEEEEDCNKRSKLPLFSMRRCSILQSSDEAEVFVKSPHSNSPTTPATFRIAGYFRGRCCKIYGSKGEEVARISPKMASKSVMLGDDVFSLVVQPGIDCEMVMAFVVIMDRICKKSYSPLMCS